MDGRLLVELGVDAQHTQPGAVVDGGETGDETAGFIEYGYWDGAREGLLAGDKLQLSLRRLENAYLDGNRRELELSKSVSLVRLNPLALVELRETGRCYVTLPEELFDLDFRGHYFRRIKSVRVSIPCSAGPHTSVSCTLRLLSNAVRVTTAMNASGDYEHENDEGMWIDDPRFRTSDTPVTAIAASAALTDPGMFELNFRDERYIPFEFAGVISRWAIELSTDRELRQFDYSKISDVVMHLNYTAREGGELFKDRATDHLKDFLRNAAELSDQPLKQLFAVRGEFPTEWRQFLWPAAAGDEQLLRLTIGRRRFPFLVGDRNVVVTRVDLFARSTQAVTYDAILTTVDRDGATTESNEFSMPPSTGYGGLNHVRLEATDTGLDLEGIDIDRELSLKLKRTGAPDYTALVTQPEEIQDVLLVFHYRLG